VGSSSKEQALMRFHEKTRSRGVNTLVYWLTRAVLQPAMTIYFRLARIGRHNIPSEGGLLLAANHRSFLDPFVIGCCVRRPVYFVAKQELFKNPLYGWFLNCLGAFPIKRGESDDESMKTARMLLERGEVVVIFPEGTRIRRGALRQPKRGVGRLALEAGVPVVPVAVHGSERARRGYVFRPVKVKVRAGRPITFPRVENPSPHLAGEVTARIWPCVELQWEWLGGLPAMRKAVVVGGGSAGTAMSILLARAGMDVQLGTRNPAAADRIAAAHENEDYLPGLMLPDNVTPTTLSDIEFGGADLVVFAVPSSDLPAAVGSVGARIGDRTSVLVLTKGLVAPFGSLPTRYVSERAGARAIAVLGGPAHAAEAVERGASVVLATTDADLQQQLGEALTKAGLYVEPSDDVAGVELAGVAKNAATIAAAAAASDGANAAGAAAARVFREVHGLATLHGGKPETFIGLAGAGDLVATACAEHSRNRRAGELLGRGIPREQIAAALPQAAEGLDFVPLLVDALDAAGVDAPATKALGDLVAGRIDRSAWLESVRAHAA
jgi:glycerol-3-phosphate dehydrogenase (NAD(P)+)